jgi:hypothetical protein
MFSCAGAVVQRLCHSPSRKPSEASRQRQLEHVLGGSPIADLLERKIIAERQSKWFDGNILGSLSFGVVKLTRITSHHRPMASLTAGNSRQIRFLMGRKNGFANFTTGFLREPHFIAMLF